jgi:adenine-specific DNA-methyltransferase
LKGYNSTREARQELGKLDFADLVAAFAEENADSVFQPTAISDAAGRTIVDVRERSKADPQNVYVVRRDDFDDVYVLNGRQIYFYANKIKTIDGERTPAKPLTNLWTDIPWNGIAREGGVVFKNGKKPEKLLRRCIEMCTDKGDIVLDSFAGSGTTGAVAHKMQRRWIMVELGDHCETHIVPRLSAVVEGRDSTGVTSVEGWQGGGGFRYFTLAPSLLERDQFGNWVISKSYNAEMLSEAMCKHFGFTYAPSDEHYWMHGRSSDTDFIYVTTASLTHDQLRAISQEVGDERTLLIACKAFQTPDADGFPNLTLRKIPAAVLNGCEWGKDDYSLKIENLPMMEEVEEDEEDQSDLFTGEAAE